MVPWMVCLGRKMFNGSVMDVWSMDEKSYLDSLSGSIKPNFYGAAGSAGTSKVTGNTIMNAAINVNNNKAVIELNEGGELVFTDGDTKLILNAQVIKRLLQLVENEFPEDSL